MAGARLAQGQPNAALAEIELEREPTARTFTLPLVLDALSRASEAGRGRADAEAKYGKEYPYQIGLLYAAHKDLVRAFAWWDRAFQQHDTNLIYVKMAPAITLMPQLAADPRFKALLRKMKLPE